MMNRKERKIHSMLPFSLISRQPRSRLIECI